MIDLEEIMRRIAREEIAAAQVQRAENTQHNRPAWAPTPNVFLRAWRVLASEGHPGAIARGKTRILTAAASDEWLARASRRKPRVEATQEEPKARDVDAEVLAELGGRRRGRGSR